MLSFVVCVGHLLIKGWLIRLNKYRLTLLAGAKAATTIYQLANGVGRAE